VVDTAAVASASPFASEAGLEMLRMGGNAIDAAVATAFALGVVEPQMSGLGGGGAMLIWLQSEGRAEYLDFYAAQPAAAFRRGSDPAADGPRDLRIVAVPGEVAGLWAAHERFGRLAWEAVLEPAIRLASGGFPVNQILAQMIAGDSAKLAGFGGFDLLYPGGAALSPGARLQNTALAESLRRVAARGPAGFYDGRTAAAVVAAMNAGGHPVSLEDFGAYEPRWQRPLCTVYRGRVVLSAPPPQTGTQILHTLELLERYDLAALGLPTRNARAFDVLTGALRLGSTVRALNGDPRWVESHARGLVSEGYADERSSLVGGGRVPEEVRPLSAEAFTDEPYDPACAALDPWSTVAPALAGGPGITAPARLPGVGGTTGAGETTHLSVVDSEGNAVALSQTNSMIFGSGAFVEGFFLNDSGYRFEPRELEGSLPADGWRTRTSTIAPTIVLEDGRVRMVAGAPGGGRIPTAIVQNMVYVLDYDMDPLEAVRMPRVFPDRRDRTVQLENGFSPEVLEQARSMGYAPEALSFGYARLYMIVRVGDQWIAVADPRHDGEARGY
jgi:gamma-glutamyltranspeptidase/glutathione hydrolase